MLVDEYVKTVDKISQRDLRGEKSQIQEWFRGFHNRNGFFEAMVLCRILGGNVCPLHWESGSNKQIQIGNDTGAVWLVVPTLSIKMKCNGKSCIRLTGPGGLFAECVNTEIGYYYIIDIIPDIRNDIERIAEMIKAEMTEYLVYNEELKSLFVRE